MTDPWETQAQPQVFLDLSLTVLRAHPGDTASLGTEWAMPGPAWDDSICS